MPGKITGDVTTDLRSDPDTQPDDASPPDDKTECIDMVICSFALHLIETPSELFALLWELSTRCRWLVILAPHKRPEVRRQISRMLEPPSHAPALDQRWVGLVQMGRRVVV